MESSQEACHISGGSAPLFTVWGGIVQMNVRSPGKGKGLLVAVETTVNLPRVQWMWATVLLNQQAEGLLFILDGDD